MYNIVYSITFHQSVDFVNHFLKNIIKIFVHKNENYNKYNIILYLL